MSICMNTVINDLNYVTQVTYKWLVTQIEVNLQNNYNWLCVKADRGAIVIIFACHTPRSWRVGGS